MTNDPRSVHYHIKKGPDDRAFFLIAFVEFVTAAAVTTTVTAAATTKRLPFRTCFAGLRFCYRDGTTIYFSLIQLSDSFLSFLIVRHFNETKSTATAREFVGDNFCRRYFAVLCKDLEQILVLNLEAQIGHENVHF